MFNARAYKKKTKRWFDAIASVYDEGLSALLLSLHQKMLEQARLQTGETVLNLGCGTGMDSFLTAPLIGEEGSVVGIDIAPEMVRLANEKAGSRGLDNVTFQVMDAEKLKFKANHFDAIISQWALMFFPNDRGALREAYRVLKPGGRFALSVVGRPENSPFLMVPFRVVAKTLPGVAISEGGPPTFRFAREGALEAALSQAGFVSTWSGRYASMITVKDADTYWELFTKWVGGFAYRFAQEPAEVREPIIREIKETVAQHATADGIRLQIESVIAVGYKPGEGDALDTSKRYVVRTPDELIQTAQVRAQAIDVGDAQQAQQQEALLIDVRQRDEFERSHIAGARHIPRGRIEELLTQEIPDTRHSIICYCDSGERSSLAAAALLNLGYSKAYWLTDGIAGWEQAGGTLSSGEQTRS
ncbi:methyltransferase domain-containing protein [Haliangium ochraceum]|uniref:Methyltransferase type 11 n=1 Tax=Haliangium ochraceum (strain DSM 14365 / JCM 11303 / SMP-2) TaxID=502025 RepID=D0LMD2_HALO1|nr:methyltransferase domain-containing protein [Haliangium ochraceum]ACY16838.1 Methyltransferase type 11 [Haliangium ochraceum DSM 14365]